MACVALFLVGGELWCVGDEGCEFHGVFSGLVVVEVFLGGCAGEDSAFHG